MPKGPRIHPDILDCLIEFVRLYPDSSAKVLQERLQNKLSGENIPVPKERTLQKYMKLVRDHMRHIQEQPWNLAKMDEVGIPWEAGNFLLRASVDLQKEGVDLWPWTANLLKDLQLPRIFRKKLRYRKGMMTNRQAKWLWRIYITMPMLTLSQLCYRADEYAHRERVAEYLDREFDTSDLDGGLRNLLRSIEDRATSPDKEKMEEEKRERRKKE